ncbi:MAG: L-glutamate gamma-semialdehyde dehydrogenase [Candidatus Dormibacteria bacterium]
MAVESIAALRNEPVRAYAPGSPERESLKTRLRELAGTITEVRLRIGGEEVGGSGTTELTAPHRHDLVLARVHRGSDIDTARAIESALSVRAEWAATPWEQRAAIFLRAADLLAGEWRDTVNAATMLGQSKTAHQSEIDAACELIDFWRFNVRFAERIFQDQPISEPPATNRMEYRALEGFVFAVTPFNFTSIAGNLPTAPALLGNVVVWKPAEKQMLAAHFLCEVLEAAGVPPGVINLVSGDAAAISRVALAHEHLAGVHFTGSTEVFQSMWSTVGAGIAGYRTYPRLVGETGGKDFVIAHRSADPDALVTALVRGAFEYQGQKCSAVSRAYVPQSLWNAIRPRLTETVESIAVGDVADFRNFMGAVIDERAFERHRTAIAEAAAGPATSVVAGGRCDRSVGWFVSPTVVETTDPGHRLMRDELFGPILTVYPYPDQDWDRALELCDSTSPYALTGAVFARDLAAVDEAGRRLLHAAGNFYVNDKPTGAVVGQQPFGGARASGTNDKAGSFLNLCRWLSPRTVKENHEPPVAYGYPFMEAE